MKLSDPKNFVHPKQPTFIYNTKKSWEKVIEEDPIWLSKKFPPRPKERKYSFLGHKLISPIAIAAGPASKKLWTDFYFKMGYGLVFEKTRRTVPRKSHEIPNIAFVNAREPITRDTLNKHLTVTNKINDWEKYKTITNSFGNPSPAMEVWTKELTEQRKGVGDGQLLGCSVTATFLGKDSACVNLFGKNTAALTMEIVSDLLMAASAAVTAGAQVIEFNLACPNVTDNKEEGEMFQDEKLVSLTLTEFKRRYPQIPAGFKFGVYKSKDQMKRVFVSASDDLDYVSGINAIAMPIKGKGGKSVLPGREASGISGKADQVLALEEIKWAAKIRDEEGLKYEILGGGGIVEVSDVDRYLNAGADMVQIATIAMINPLLAYEYRLHKLGQLS